MAPAAPWLRRHDGLGEGRPRGAHRFHPRLQKFLFRSSGLEERRRLPGTEPWWFHGFGEKRCGHTGVSHGDCGAKLPVRGATWCLCRVKLLFLSFSLPFFFVFGHRLFCIRIIRSRSAFYG